jgi:chromosome segregation ATPase
MVVSSPRIVLDACTGKGFSIMLKKLVIAAAAVVVGLVLLRTTTMGSLAQVWWKNAGNWVQRQVPPETKIEQLKLEVGKIDKDITKAINQLVVVEVGYEKLQQETENLKARQVQRKKDMTVLSEALEAGSKQVSLNSQTYNSDTAQRMLDRAVAEFRTGREALKVKEELLKNKQEQRDLADQRIKEIQGRKAELVELVGKLETQLELVKLKKTQSRIEISDSQVSKCDRLAEDIKTLLAEETKRAEKYQRYGLVTSTAPTVKEEKSRAESIKAAREVLAEEGVAGDK